LIKAKNTSPQVRLAYKFDIYATSPVSRGDLYIDATTNAALYYNATIKHLGEYSHAKKRNQWVWNTKSKAVKALYASGNAATRYSATQSIKPL
jgi:hypothetical protein